MQSVMRCSTHPSPWPPSRPGLGLGLLLALSLQGMACDASPTWSPDGAVPKDAASPPPDVSPWTDGASPLFAAVAVSGCSVLGVDETSVRCQGPAPLQLSFSALGPPTVQRFIWDFGDGSAPSSAAAPTHRYDHPGEYSVTLVLSSPSGPISPTRQVLISVSRADLGAYCSSDGQCAGARCLCGVETEQQCPSALQGVCSAPCPACGDAGVCANLTVPDATEIPEWRMLTCLPACETSVDCERTGFGCVAVPTRDATGDDGWGRACLPDLVHPLGHGCTSSLGALDDLACVTGDCAPLGRFGLCTAPCEDRGCPEGADCVRFSAAPLGDEAVCLLRCSAAEPCTADPALGCTAPDPSGDLGFEVLSSDAPVGATYCAPRRCLTPADCPSGLCDLPAGGFCQ